MGKDRRQQIYVEFVADIDIKILGVPPHPSGFGMPFLDSDTYAEGGGGVIYFCQGFLPRMMPFHRWMESFTENDHDVLYYMYNIIRRKMMPHFEGLSNACQVSLGYL
jgi:hypothetical protein